MMIVEFVHWESRYEDIRGTWQGTDHWVPRDEQVWFGDVRYTVVRVEHVDSTKVICFVKEMT